MELTDIEIEQIAEQLKGGYTSGQICNYDSETVLVFISWKLEFEKWAED